MKNTNLKLIKRISEKVVRKEIEHLKGIAQVRATRRYNADQKKLEKGISIFGTFTTEYEEAEAKAISNKKGFFAFVDCNGWYGWCTWAKKSNQVVRFFVNPKGVVV